jgi:CTP synthase (UTP-ammonia lyase)
MADIRIGIVGDYDPARETHTATDAALEHAAAALGMTVAAEWIPTDELQTETSVLQLKYYHAVFLGPGAPYRSQDGAIAAVRFARELGWPFFGT